MKKINILESLLELDKKSSNRYELATLYEACKLKDDEKVELVKYIDSYEHPSLIGQFLESKCEGMCDTNVDDDDCTDIECLKKTVDDINDNEVPVIFAFDDIEEKEMIFLLVHTASVLLNLLVTHHLLHHVLILVDLF